MHRRVHAIGGIAGPEPPRIREEADTKVAGVVRSTEKQSILEAANDSLRSWCTRRRVPADTAVRVSHEESQQRVGQDAARRLAVT